MIAITSELEGLKEGFGGQANRDFTEQDASSGTVKIAGMDVGNPTAAQVYRAAEHVGTARQVGRFDAPGAAGDVAGLQVEVGAPAGRITDDAEVLRVAQRQLAEEERGLTPAPAMT
jgi:hypothetical protein